MRPAIPSRSLHLRLLTLSCVCAALPALLAMFLLARSSGSPGALDLRRSAIALGLATAASVSLVAAGTRLWLRAVPVAPAALARSRDAKFLAHAAHELRTPLAVLRAMAEQSLIRERTQAEYRATLLELADEARRAGDLVEHLLDLARIDTGAIRLDEDVSLRSLASRLVERERRLRPEANLSVRADGDPRVRGSRPLLERAVSTLLANAVKHAGSGARIVVFSERKGEEALIGVEDDGPGIAPQDISRLLNRFERGENAQGSGTGLGLPIAEGLARAHGGRLEICRAALGGCRAAIHLPEIPG